MRTDTAISREYLKPKNILLRMSLPARSVPQGYSRQGDLFAFLKSTKTKAWSGWGAT